MMRGPAAWSHEGVLWTIGARFTDATVENFDETVDWAIEELVRHVTCEFVSITRVDHRTRTPARQHGWSAGDQWDLPSGTSFDVEPEFAVRFLAGNGMEIAPLGAVLGDEIVREHGWTAGTVAVSLIDQSEHHTSVLVVAGVEGDWSDEEIQLMRAFATLLRQFMARARSERRLHDRLRLEDLVSSVSARLIGVGAHDLQPRLDLVLRDVHRALELDAAMIVDIVDDWTIRIGHIVADAGLPDVFEQFTVADLSMLPGGEGCTVADYVATSRVLDVGEIIHGIGGDALHEAMNLHRRPRTVAILPASATTARASAVAAARLGAEVEWRPEELETLSTVASLIAQTRARVAAEADSSFRLGVQRALAETAADFLTVDARDAADAVTRAIERMGAQLDADFAVLSEVDAERDRFVIDRAWSREAGEIDPDGAVFHDPEHRWIGPVVAGRAVVGVEGPESPNVELGAAMEVEVWSFASAPVRDNAHGVWSLGFVWAHGHPGEGSTVCELVQSVADLVGQLRSRLGAQLEVARRLELDAVLSSIADDFLGAAASDHDEVVAEALERLSAHIGLAYCTIRRFEGDGSVLEVTHAALGGEDLEAVAETLAELGERVRDGEWIQPVDPPAQSVASTPDGRNVAGTVISGPIMVGSEIRAALSGMRIDQADWLPVEFYAFRSFATMLGQLRARVEAERSGDRQLAAQRVLGECAVDLAEARSDDFRSTLESVLGRVGRFIDVDSLRIWQVDRVSLRYRGVATWEHSGERPVVAPVDPAWGDDPVLDATRAERRRIVIEVDEPSDPAVAHVAVPRGDGRVDAILLASRASAGPWRADTVELLEALSRTIHQVESRIAAERYAETAFDAAPIGVVLRDHLLRLVTCNQAFVDFLGAESIDELIGTMPGDVYDDSFDDIEWNDNDGHLTAEGAYRRRNGGRVWGQMRASVIESGQHGEPMWLVHVEDVTERRRAEQLLRFQASHDELTGLANRRELLEEVRRVASGSGSVAILLLDLDRFKLINDSLGHDRGDELLVAVADRLRLAVRPGDLVARLGGDEFAVVLPGPVTVTEAEFVADRLLGLIGEPITLDSQEVFPRASIGIAVADDGMAVSELLRRADTAMYRAKASGRSRHEAFDEELRHEVVTRMATEAGLRGALRSDELIVHYQPEVSLVTGEVLAVEALVRWDHPERGLLAAGEFIEVAEETGLVIEIGTRVLFEACRDAADWPGGDAAPILRVNLSAAQIQRDDTIAIVRDALDASGLPPMRLCLEITESAVMFDLDRSGETLERLKELGVTLAVDDFGTGFSSLAYLKLFPVDLLKIDRTFVAGLPDDADDTAVVRSIVSLAEALDLGVVAEGVETEAQAAALLELGCGRAQGYLFARPAPADELLTRFVVD